ncbi:IS1 transposase [archaeon]|nr:IS1 transposase [archaeon]
MVIRQKKQKKVDPGDAGADRHGDCWIYIATKTDTKLHLAHSTGKRIQDTADRLTTTVKKCGKGKAPAKDDKATFISDGNDQYTTTLLENFDADTINYVQLVKERENGRVMGKTMTIIFGSMENEDIDTVYVERYNLTLRHGISRLVRKSLCFSKCREMLDNHLDVYQCYNNLIKTNSALSIETHKGIKNLTRTPCMVEEITEHPWTWKEFLMSKVSHEN